MAFHLSLSLSQAFVLGCGLRLNLTQPPHQPADLGGLFSTHQQPCPWHKTALDVAGQHHRSPPIELRTLDPSLRQPSTTTPIRQREILMHDITHLLSREPGTHRQSLLLMDEGGLTHNQTDTQGDARTFS